MVSMLVGRATALLPAEGEVAINDRHRLALSEACEWIDEAAGAADLLIVAEAIRQALRSLDRVTGRAGVEAALR